MNSMKHILLMLLAAFSLFSHAQTELVNFESAPVNVRIDSLTGCWQIGAPSKTIFDTAFSSTHALITDTLNPYPDNSVSYAYFSFPTGSISGSYSITLQHRWDFESNTDGGYIEIFDCFSQTWIDPAQVVFGCPFYLISYSQNGPTESLFNGKTGFGNSSNGWVETQLFFGCAALANTPVNRSWDSTQLRFVMVSDATNTTNEGWMIDNIYWEDFGGICAGISENINSLPVSIFPSVATDQISFESESENFSTLTIYDFSGKKIELFTFPSTNFHTLQLSKLACGMYFYSVNEGKATGKFMIEK